MRAHLRLSNGTTWPNPLDPNEVQWRLRYAEPTRADLLHAASVMHAYAHLTAGPGNKQLPLLRRAVRGLAGNPDKDGDE